MSEWERQALSGDFSQMPRPFRWDASARFAHLLNGYEEAGGFDRLSRLHYAIAEAARETGRWEGTARDLWLCLFFEHRAARHTGSDAEGIKLQELNNLCEVLRVALQSLDTRDASSLASRTKPE